MIRPLKIVKLNFVKFVNFVNLNFVNFYKIVKLEKATNAHTLIKSTMVVHKVSDHFFSGKTNRARLMSSGEL